MKEPSLWVIESRDEKGEWSIVRYAPVFLSPKGAKDDLLYCRRRTKIELRVAEYRRRAERQGWMRNADKG